MDVLRVLYERALQRSRGSDASLTIPRINELLVTSAPSAVVRLILDKLESDGYVISPKRGVRDRFEITLNGIMHYRGIENSDKGQNSIRADSAAWTGLPRDFSLSERRRAEIIRQLDLVESALSLSGLSQENQAQARAYVIAVRVLLEAPEPQADLAWEIIGRANNIAGIASLFVAIIALFQAAI